MRRLFLALPFLTLLSLPVWSDDRADATKKQRDIALAKLKKANIKANVVETDDVMLFADMPEERAKTITTTMQKTYTAAAKTLKYEPTDTPFGGKLSVFVFTDSRQYKFFVLDAMQKPTTKGETFSTELRGFDGKGDVPFVMYALDPVVKSTDAALAAELAGLTAGAVINRKAGAGTGAIPFDLPQWLRAGFGNAMYLRAAGNQTKLSAHQQKVKGLYSKTQGKAFVGSNVWGGMKNADLDTLTTSFVEYLAFGPDASKFVTFINAFKPGDNNNTPTVDAVLTAMDWKSDWLETSWKTWVMKGK